MGAHITRLMPPYSRSHHRTHTHSTRYTKKRTHMQPPRTPWHSTPWHSTYGTAHATAAHRDHHGCARVWPKGAPPLCHLAPATCMHACMRVHVHLWPLHCAHAHIPPLSPRTTRLRMPREAGGHRLSAAQRTRRVHARALALTHRTPHSTLRVSPCVRLPRTTRLRVRRKGTTSKLSSAPERSLYTGIRSLCAMRPESLAIRIFWGVRPPSSSRWHSRPAWRTHTHSIHVGVRAFVCTCRTNCIPRRLKNVFSPAD